MGRNTEVFKFFVGREKKGKAAFPPLLLLRGFKGVGQNWNGKTSWSNRRSVSELGGLEWKVCATSVGRTCYKEFILCISASIGLRFL
jgi:hypothetical protein